MDLERAVTFPTRGGDEWYVTILVGGVIAIASVLLLPVFLLAGYLVQVSREAMAGASEPPEFDDWNHLFVEGLKATAILVVYQVVPLLVAALVAGGSFLALRTGLGNGVVAVALGLSAGVGVFGALGLVFSYLGLAGLMNFAARGSVGAAFDVDTLVDVATDRDWLLAWAYALGVSIVFNVALSIVGMVPVLGWLLVLFAGPFAGFYVAVVLYRIYGLGFAEATATGSVTSDVTAAEPA